MTANQLLAVAAGICIGVAIIWWPAAWVTKFRTDGWLRWQRGKSDRPEWANDRLLERLATISSRMLALWHVAVVLGVVGVALIVVAVA